MVDKVSIELTVEERDAIKALARLSKGLKKTQDETDKTSRAFDTFKGAISAIGVSKGLAVLNQQFKNFLGTLNESIELAKVQEDAVNSLNIALAQSGKFSAQASKDFQEYASSLQEASKFGDEVIIQNAALIQSLGKLDTQGLKKATQAALDLSAALGIDLRTASNLVGRAATGNIELFSRYGVTIQKGATASETFENALQKLNQQFGGAALGQIRTYSGAQQQLSNTIGDFQEVLGQTVTENRSVIGVFNGIAKAVQNLTKDFEENKGEIQTLITDGILLLVGSISTVGTVINGAIRVFNGLDAALDGIATLFVDVGQKALEFQSTLLSGAAAVTRAFGGDTSGLDRTREGIDKVVQSIKNGQAASKAANQERRNDLESFGEALAQNATVFENTIRRQIELSNEQSDNTIENINNNAKAAADAARGRVELEASTIQQIKGIRAQAAEQEALLSVQDGTTSGTDEERLNQLKLFLDRQTELKLEAINLQLSQEENAQKRAVLNEKKALTQKQAIFAAEEKARKTSLSTLLVLDKQAQSNRAANFKSSLSTISTLTQSSNRTLFAIGKASAVSEATIQGILATQRALAAAPPPFNYVLAAAVGVAAASNVSRIAAQKPPSFQEGGVVDLGGVPSSQDNQIAAVASGEAILTQQDQLDLFELIRNGVGTAGQIISINIDGREIARALRDVQNDGVLI